MNNYWINFIKFSDISIDPKNVISDKLSDIYMYIETCLNTWAIYHVYIRFQLHHGHHRHFHGWLTASLPYVTDFTWP